MFFGSTIFSNYFSSSYSFSLLLLLLSRCSSPSSCGCHPELLPPPAPPLCSTTSRPWSGPGGRSSPFPSSTSERCSRTLPGGACRVVASGATAPRTVGGQAGRESTGINERERERGGRQLVHGIVRSVRDADAWCAWRTRARRRRGARRGRGEGEGGGGQWAAAAGPQRGHHRERVLRCGEWPR